MSPTELPGELRLGEQFVGSRLYVPPHKRHAGTLAAAAQRHGVPTRRCRMRDEYHPRAWARLSRAQNQERALRRLVELCAAAELACAPQDGPCRMLSVQQLDGGGAAEAAPDAAPRRLFVQPLKRMRSDDGGNGQERYAFLELSSASGDGWLSACECDYVAFEVLDGFLLAPWAALWELSREILAAEQGVAPIRHFRFSRQIYRRLLSRDAAESAMPTDERLTVISLERDVLPLQGAQLLLVEHCAAG